MAQILPLKLTVKQATDHIRKLAAETGKIVILAHAAKRQKQRKITRRQIELCLL